MILKIFVSRHHTWREAVDEALRRHEVCSQKFGRGEPHCWVFRVHKEVPRFHMWRDRHTPRWVVTFNSSQNRIKT